MESILIWKDLWRRLALSIIIGGAAIVGLSILGFYNYLFFHSLVEMFSIIVAYCVFALTWHLRSMIGNGYIVFVGIAYLYVGMMDMFHLMTFSGMTLIPGSSANMATQFWLSGRALESFSLFLGLWIGTYISKHIGWVHFVFSLISAFLLGSILYWEWFPICYLDASGLTLFKIASEYFFIVILLITFVQIVRRNDIGERYVVWLLAISILTTALSEWAFTYYRTPRSFANLIGHELKVISYYLIFKAIVKTGIEQPYALLFTDLKRNEAALKNSEERFRQAVDHYPGVFVIYDTLRRIRYINAKGADLAGHKREDIIGKTDEAIFPESLTGGYLPLLDRVLQDRKELSREVRLELPTGRFTFVFNFVPIFGANGDIQQILGIAMDVTARKNAEMQTERLLRGQVAAKQTAEKMVARHRAILDSMTEGLVIFNAGGELEEMNPAASSLYGFPMNATVPRIQDEFIKQFSMRNMNGVLLPYHEYPLARVSRGERFAQYEVEVQHLAGGRNWVGSFGGAPVYDSDGNHILSLITFRDMTREKEIQLALRNARDELEMRVAERTASLSKANEELREFAYVASHDLQEPLRKINYFGTRLEELPTTDLDETGRDFLARMLRAAQRMRRLIDSLLHYSRASSKDMDFTTVDLNDIVQVVVEDMEPYIQEVHGCVVWKDLPRIRADSSQMFQLFQNLINNGLKFNDQEKRIVRITAQRANDCHTARKRFTTLRVEDNGIGIPREYVEDIFAPFQRLHSEKAYPGTGIGLAICKKIVERHGGTIAAWNGRNEGTAFIVTLPEQNEVSSIS